MPENIMPNKELLEKAERDLKRVVENQISGKTLKELQEEAKQIAKQIEKDKEIFRRGTSEFLTMPKGPWDQESDDHLKIIRLREEVENLKEQVAELRSLLDKERMYHE